MSPDQPCPEDDFGLLMGQLTEEQTFQCIARAACRFFCVDYKGLHGSYVICNFDLVRGRATDDEMREDAARFGLDPVTYKDCWRDMLMEKLSEAWDRVLYDQLKAEVEGNAL